ncbi:hypothetical protein BRYFOR_06659 [Marvinbryantia formatexigens DSM 14469]|uniref:DUF4179 domain-containing protein n=1 Tax=Marvinbryantia formatexigens DSM 14469 TaxID=478749 RepID=C6LD01_9FIRM|nr:DUF4179 domain-containing protein [Marvinbryantia formatexigens]EET61484.1 hypothetical protein BRYFOR_06659 [Marvinbryantia formatexigens DSM 14469]UWO26140.1 DUF4179 domain-containing protein [Marvinbryantia formatexigens DSM 14469]SDF92303.1 hypothetical protein SAMN05660368_01595 [Marvinbryantia formatexigens]
MREKELKFLEIFGEIDDVLILEAAAEPQRETFAGRTIQSAQRETFDGGTIQSAQRETSGGRQPVQRETFAGHTMQHKTKRNFAGRAACAVLVVLLGLSCMFHNEVRAAIRNFSTLIGQALGLSEDLTPYAKMPDLTQTREGISLTLKEAILSGNHLFAVLELDAEADELQEICLSNSGLLAINGKAINCASTGISYIDERHYIFEWGFSDEEIPDIADISFEAMAGRGMDDTEPVTFSFAFSASRKELEDSTLICDVGQKVQIEPDFYVNVERLTLNSIYGTLEVSGDGREFSGNAQYFIQGRDSIGNPVRFTLEGIDKNCYTFKTGSAYGLSATAPSVNSEWIELQFYKLEMEELQTEQNLTGDGDFYFAVSDVGDVADAEPVGETFRIDLKK